MTGQIGYYVHHHGDGHRQRALAIAKAAPGCFTLLGTGLAGRTDDIPHIDLSDDYGGSGQPESRIGTGESLHYAPYCHDGIRQRVAAISEWIARAKPSLLVVDVSVEVAMLARLTSTPMVYVRLSGSRRDAPHLDAFRAAVAIVSPFHRDLDDPGVISWVRDKTSYLPGLSRTHTGPKAAGDSVLVVCGKGGGAFVGDDVAAAAAATPEMTWRAIGPVTPPRNLPANLSIGGWVEAADKEIANAGVVIGHPGDGLVSAVIATGRPFICLPQPRPFDEQIVKASRLEALGVAVVLRTWPSAAAWPGLLERAKTLDRGAANRLHDPDGAVRAARLLKAFAGFRQV
jgi:hypothetical protein